MANLLYRASTSATTPGSTSAKGSPLTNLEVDGNFKSVNDDLALKATIASPTFTGTPAAPTAAVNTNTTQLATTAFVVAQIADDAPTKSGSGATGTWGISISGNAATATSATSATSATTAGTTTNIAGGTAGGVVYQSGSGATGITLAGSAGQVLISNGTSAPSWSTFNALPSQSGNNGKYLTTDGSTASWATITTGITATDDTSTDTSYYPALFTATSGSQTAAKVSSTSLYFNPSTGTLNATVFNSLSDLNQKTNVVKIENATETLKQIEGFEFDWIGNNNHSAGVIAQYLEKILPFLVQTNENGEKSVNYSGLIAYLIESNKELSARLDALETK